MTSPDIDDVLFGWGQRLAAARTAAGLNQPQLAAELGVSTKTIQRWEATGRHPDATRPNLAQQRRLAQILDVPISDLLPRSNREATLEGVAAEHDDLLERIGGGCS